MIEYARGKFFAFVIVLMGFSANAHACSLSFTSPGHGAKVGAPGVVVRGTGSGSAQPGDAGTVTALHNGTPFFSQSGTFTAIVSFLESAGAGVQLVPGKNHFVVSGSVSGCSASDSMTVYYDDGSDPELAELEPEKNLGDGDYANGPANCAGNPIHFAMGHKVQTETDWVANHPSAFPLRFSRTFNSADGYWRHNYATRLRISADKITLILTDGRRQTFGRNGTHITRQADEQGTLAAVTPSAQNGGATWLYTAQDRQKYGFDAKGRLLRHSHPHGLFHQLAWAADGDISVTDSLGNALSFTQDAQLQPTSFTAPGTSIAYAYDALGRLNGAAKTSGASTTNRSYHYENPHYPLFLTGITDARDLRFATYSYDGLGRAITSQHAGGADNITVSYHADGNRTVTNALGKTATYHFGIVHGVKRIVQIEGEPTPNCPASNSSFTYNAQGLLASHTNKLGHTTQYAYNARGLQTIKTEAVGTDVERSTITQWHPALPVPVRREQPGRIQSWTYDTQGRPLSHSITSE